MIDIIACPHKYERQNNQGRNEIEPKAKPKDKIEELIFTNEFGLESVLEKDFNPHKEAQEDKPNNLGYGEQ